MNKRQLVFCSCCLAGFTLALLLALPAYPQALAVQESAQESGWIQSAEALGIQLCMTCHGAYGQGSPVVGGPNLAGMEPWYLKRQLELFRAGARGYEKAYIPAYEMRRTAEALSDADIARLVATVGTWPPVATAASIAGDVARSAILYQPCAACHGAQAEGNEVLGAPALHNRNDWYLLNQLKLFKSGWRGAHPADGPGLQMRAMLVPLASAADMRDVLAFINTIEAN